MARMLGMIVLVALTATGAAHGSDAFSLPPAPLPYMFGGQTTVVWQYHPAFRSPYQGPNSLRHEAEDAVSHSYTLYTGIRLQPWLDLYVDPEMIRGAGISSGIGLAGYTNGEVIRNPEAGQGPYLGRAFLRATVPLGQDSEEVEPDLLQVGGSRPAQRIVLTGGVLAAADLFDTNRYANATRTQFLNWSFINNTAWDFAADTRGYSRGGAIDGSRRRGRSAWGPSRCRRSRTGSTSTATCSTATATSSRWRSTRCCSPAGRWRCG